MFLKPHRSGRDYLLKRCHPNRSKRFEPITVGPVLLIQRHLGDEKAALKLAERRYRGNNKAVDMVRWLSA